MPEETMGAGVIEVRQPYHWTLAETQLGLPCTIEMEGRMVRGTVVSVTPIESDGDPECVVTILEDE